MTLQDKEKKKAYSLVLHAYIGLVVLESLFSSIGLRG